MENALKKEAEGRMEKAIESLRKDLSTMRTGRASLALLEGIMVDYYGTATPINQVAALSVPDPKSILIQPWEPKIIGEVEKAILRSDLGLTPSNDGKTVRVNIPVLTEERRKQLVKLAKKRAEESRVAIRNIRRDTNDELKRLEKEKHVSEDVVKKSLDEVQKLTDLYIKKVEEVLAHKEAEIMEV